MNPWRIHQSCPGNECPPIIVFIGCHFNFRFKICIQLRMSQIKSEPLYFKFCVNSI
jgi:hypothetical protein